MDWKLCSSSRFVKGLAERFQDRAPWFDVAKVLQPAIPTKLLNHLYTFSKKRVFQTVFHAKTLIIGARGRPECLIKGN